MLDSHAVVPPCACGLPAPTCCRRCDAPVCDAHESQRGLCPRCEEACWTPERVALLRETYGSGGSAAAERAFPGMRPNTLAVAARRYRIAAGTPCGAHARSVVSPKRERAPAPCRWTPDALATLRAAYATGGLAAARDALPDRTDSALTNAARAYGIRARPRSDSTPRPWDASRPDRSPSPARSAPLSREQRACVDCAATAFTLPDQSDPSVRRCRDPRACAHRRERGVNPAEREAMPYGVRLGP